MIRRVSPTLIAVCVFALAVFVWSYNAIQSGEHIQQGTSSQWLIECPPAGNQGQVMQHNREV